MTQERPQDVEDRIAEDRARLDRTVSALQARLSPGQLLDQALDYVKSGGGETAGNLGRTVRENPLPVILTGVGLAWLMTSTSSSGRAAGGPAGMHTGEDHRRADAAAAALTQEAGETREKFEERKTEARGRALKLQRQAEETADAFRRRVEEAMSSLSSGTQERGRHVAASAGGTAGQVRGQASSFLTEQPLIAAAAAVGVGALIGSLLPSTRMEQETFGETAEEVRRRAAHAAGDVGERAERVASDTARAAADTAHDSARREAGQG
jgi:ElaB/YqjD/DUF883 family membrane-anchored ribosome-binding protein